MVIHDPLFGGGCRIKVKRVLPPKNDKGWRVSVLLEPDDGRAIEQRGRCWGLASWLESARRASDELAAAPTPAEGENNA